MHFVKKSLVLLTLLSLSSCVVKPTMTHEYHKNCKVVKKKIKLSVEQMEIFDELNCSGSHECKSQFLGQIVGATLVFPISAFISGSIAVVGNTFYWLNEQGQCES